MLEKERGGASECEVTDGAGGALLNVEWVGDQVRVLGAGEENCGDEGCGGIGCADTGLRSWSCSEFAGVDAPL